jgi:hypothetical protein
MNSKIENQNPILICPLDDVVQKMMNRFRLIENRLQEYSVLSSDNDYVTGVSFVLVSQKQRE